MVHNNYPIGFWNILHATQLGPEAVQDWVDFGTTLTTSGRYYPGQDKEKFIRILDACQEKGIQVLVEDARASYHNVDNGHYEEDARQVIADFAWHPAVYGFHLGDEPDGHQTEQAVRAVQVYKELCPEKQQYLNLLPWYSDQYGGVEARVAIQTDYKQYLLDFVRRSGIGILSYDCYFQLEELHGQLTDRALETYFRNLRIFQEVAAETGIELWYTTLAVGHMMYRCPTEDDIRWEINTAVAHGVQALFYWFLYSGFYNANYRVAPINELFERTETFNWVSTENRLFQDVFGKLFTELKLEQAYHVGTAYGGFPLLEESRDPYVKKAYAANGVPLIVSRFRREADPDHLYYAVVCNSQREPASVYVEFHEPAEIFEVRSTGGKVTLSPRGLKESIQYWYAPGQMWVIAVKTKTGSEG